MLCDRVDEFAAGYTRRLRVHYLKQHKVVSYEGLRNGYFVDDGLDDDLLEQDLYET